TAALETGEPRVLARLHIAGILRDAARAAVVTALGLALAQLARDYLVGTVWSRGRVLLSVAAVGVALAAGTAGALPLAGLGDGARRARRRATAAGRAPAHRPVRAARRARRPPGVGRLATADFGARAHRRGARARPLGDLRFPDRVQHRSRRIAVVGAAGRL